MIDSVMKISVHQRKKSAAISEKEKIHFSQIIADKQRR
jgi:hypothetical protein